MTAAARLDLRLSPTDKDRIARAADLRGVPVSAFVREAVLRAADEMMVGTNPITLSPAETRRLLAALDKPFKPGRRLKEALQKGRPVALDRRTSVAGASSLAARLRGRATARMSTDQIMQLTRGA
ncbi:MAG: DUF1778 domain-containing protein [Rhodanobacteraceae bacterium]